MSFRPFPGLSDFLTPAQKRQYKLHLWFDVDGSAGGVYRIHPNEGMTGNVTVVTVSRALVRKYAATNLYRRSPREIAPGTRLCTHLSRTEIDYLLPYPNMERGWAPSRSAIPPAWEANALVQMLWIQSDEPAFLKKANIYALYCVRDPF